MSFLYDQSYQENHIYCMAILNFYAIRDRFNITFWVLLLTEPLPCTFEELVPDILELFVFFLKKDLFLLIVSVNLLPIVELFSNLLVLVRLGTDCFVNKTEKDD